MINFFKRLINPKKKELYLSDKGVYFQMDEKFCPENDVHATPVYVKKIISNSRQVKCWSIKDTNIPKTWEITKGKGKTCMVIDTGISNHVDLRDNITSNGRGFVRLRNGRIDTNWIDRNGHGTHVAGIIAAKDNNIGMVGVAPESKVIPAKALGDNGNGSFEWINNALRYAIDVKPDVVCMSLGAFVSDPSQHRLIRILYDMNIPVVCAAGNNGYNGGINYPAAYPETISVAAFDKNGNIADFSARGTEIDWAAPGVDVYSTWLNNRYIKLDGTSMAAPYIAGVILLLLAKHEIQEKETGKNDCKTVEDIRKHLLKYTIDKGMVGRDDYWGYGVLDIESIFNINSIEMPSSEETEVVESEKEEEKEIKEEIKDKKSSNIFSRLFQNIKKIFGF